MKITRLSSFAALACALFVSTAQARTWTSSDGGRKLEGELKAYDPDKGLLTVILANGKSLNFPKTSSLLPTSLF